MFKLPSGEIRAKFRKVSNKPSPAVWQALGELRKTSDPSHFPEILIGLKIAAPIHRNLMTYNPTNFEDLLFIKPMPPLPLGLELKWAQAWLQGTVPILNNYIETRHNLGLKFLQGNFGEMLNTVDEFIGNNGWSVWAVELKMAIVQQYAGNVAMKTLSKELEALGKGRASGLLSIVFADRNDNKFHFESFVGKCRTSFSRIEDKAFRVYLPYRAIGEINDPVNMLPLVISLDLSSSLFDYYETILDTIQLIRSNKTLHDYLGSALELVDALIKFGVKDYRLVKLGFSLRENGGDLPSIGTQCKNTILTDYFSEICGVTSTISLLPKSEFGKNLSDTLLACSAQGTSAPEAIMNAIKIGINFKGITPGMALVHRGIFCSNTILESSLLPDDFDMLLPEWTIEDMLIGNDELILKKLRMSILNNDCKDNDIAVKIINVIDGDIINIGELPESVVTIWLARYLMRNNRIEHSVMVCDELSNRGKFWDRQASKIKIGALSLSGEIENMLFETSRYLLINAQYAREFPLNIVFDGRAWKNFRNCDPVLVAFCSHWAQTTSPSSNVRFVCRMACRLFQDRQEQQQLDKIWVSLTGNTHSQRLLIKFLQNVWVEDNIALIDSMMSTQDVRKERIRILQYLLVWDPEESATYSTSIKELTLDEIFWQGFQQINETRIFVNEPAITRWAKKELILDFEHWKDLDNPNNSEPVSGEMLRNYLIDPSLEKLIALLPKNYNSESTSSLITMIDRLFQKFLLDPVDGLNSYLSLRIRHGSLRGTLFGPLEHEGLLISGEASREAFHVKWDDGLQIPSDVMEMAIGRLEEFTNQIQQFVKFVVDEYVQIRSSIKPNGYFYSSLNLDILQRIVLYSPAMSFQNFLDLSYQLFWETIKVYRNNLSDYFKLEVKLKFQTEIANLIAAIEPAHDGLRPLVSRLHSVSTASQVQCDSVAAWFVSNGGSEQQSYPLNVAIEIAKRATCNIYRQFPGTLKINMPEGAGILLSSMGLAVLFDSLCIVFENAWKHSGLEERLGEIEIITCFDDINNLLHIRTISNLSRERCESLKHGELDRLRLNSLTVLPVELVPKEGGSGFAKLARMVSSVDREICQTPIDFGLTEDLRWYVSFAMPLYLRGGIYDAGIF